MNDFTNNTSKHTNSYSVRLDGNTLVTPEQQASLIEKNFNFLARDLLQFLEGGELELSQNTHPDFPYKTLVSEAKNGNFEKEMAPYMGRGCLLDNMNIAHDCIYKTEKIVQNQGENEGENRKKFEKYRKKRENKQQIKVEPMLGRLDLAGRKGIQTQIELLIPIGIMKKYYEYFYPPPAKKSKNS